jgi:hypothetical protein
MDAQRVRKHSKAFAGELEPEIEAVVFTDASQQVSELAEKRWSGASGCFLGENRIFPVIFRGQILRCGRIWGREVFNRH